MATPILDLHYNLRVGNVELRQSYDVKFQSMRTYSPGPALDQAVSQSPNRFPPMPDHVKEYGYQLIDGLRQLSPVFQAFWRTCESCRVSRNGCALTLTPILDLTPGNYIEVTVMKNGEFDLANMEHCDSASLYVALLSALRFQHSRAEEDQNTPFKSLENAPQLPRQITIPFPAPDENNPSRKYLLWIQVTGLDRYGVIHPNLGDIFIWQRSMDGSWCQCLGRIEEIEGFGELELTKSSTATFKSVAGLISLMSAAMRKFSLVEPRDIAFYSPDYQFPPLNAPLAAQHAPRANKLLRSG